MFIFRCNLTGLGGRSRRRTRHRCAGGEPGAHGTRPAECTVCARAAVAPHILLLHSVPQLRAHGRFAMALATKPARADKAVKKALEQGAVVLAQEDIDISLAELRDR